MLERLTSLSVFSFSFSIYSTEPQSIPMTAPVISGELDISTPNIRFELAAFSLRSRPSKAVPSPHLASRFAVPSSDPTSAQCTSLQFVLPADMKLDTAPRPLDSRVHLKYGHMAMLGVAVQFDERRQTSSLTSISDSMPSKGDRASHSCSVYV